MHTSFSSAVFMAAPCPIPFIGCSHRSGTLSWAQEHVWGWIGPGLEQGRSLNYDLCFSVPVPADTTVAEFLAAIAALVHRHETLRTRFRRTGDGPLRQEVAGHGSVDVVRYQFHAGQVTPGLAPAGEDPRSALLRRLTGAGMLDIVNGFPFRVGFVADAEIVTHAAFAISLIVADAAACDNVVSEFAAALGRIRSGATAPPGPVFHQLDQVSWEGSADGRRAERRALEYWREQMPAIAALPRPAVLDGGAMRAVITPAEPVLTAAEQVAPASGTSSSAVILTAFLLATAQVLQLDHLGCYLHCANRSDPGRRDSVTRLKSMTVYGYSGGGPDFRAATREVFRGSLTAYRHAHSPGGLFLDRLGVAAQEAPFVQFNDVRPFVAAPGPAEPAVQGATVGPASPGEPAITEIPPEDAHNPVAVLALGVGPFVGAGSLEGAGSPILRLETNLLRMDGIALLLKRMTRILAAAAASSSAPVTSGPAE
ncbi:condensation domain-containing protein [Nonomuraea monospora]